MNRFSFNDAFRVTFSLRFSMTASVLVNTDLEWIKTYLKL
jgi:hypothetical protein